MRVINWKKKKKEEKKMVRNYRELMKTPASSKLSRSILPRSSAKTENSPI
jgi:hypothetical protein